MRRAAARLRSQQTALVDGTPPAPAQLPPGASDDVVGVVLAALPITHRLHIASVHPAPSGTRTQNISVRDVDGQRWFVKIDATGTPPEDHTAVARLTEHARSGGVPAPRLLTTTEGHEVAQVATSVVTVWEHVEHERTAEESLTTPQMTSLGDVVGRLHTRLEHYAGTTPRRRPVTSVIDVPRGRARLSDLVDQLRARPHRDDFQDWCLHAARQRLTVLPKVAALVEQLPPLHTQVVHGDLAAPNILVTSTGIAALVDFDVPRHQHSTAWEVARSGCDPRVVTKSAT